MNIDLKIYIKRISELKKFDEKVKIISNMPTTGVFDCFFNIFLLIFESEAWKLLEFKRNYEIDKFRVLKSALFSLKQELIEIAAKTLIFEIHNAKELNMLSGNNSIEQYNTFNESFNAISNVEKILIKYSVLKEIILNKLNNKLELLEQFLMNLDYSLERIKSEFGTQILYLNEIIWGTGGDSHNNGKSVLVFWVNNTLQMVYKPHTLQPDLQLEEFYTWINNHSQIQAKMHICKTIDCGNYGWQEFVIASECNSEEDVQKYYYRIGILLCLFYAIGTQDIHCENLIIDGGMPIVIDNESLFSNTFASPRDENIISIYCETMKRSVYSSIIIPQNIQGSLFDIDLSVLGEQSPKKSQKIKGVKIIEAGTSNIQMKEIYATSGKTAQRNATVFCKGRTVLATDYLDYVIRGFKDLYQIIYKEKHDFINILYRKGTADRKYRQILKATYVYSKFLAASKHPNYLKEKTEFNRLLSIMDKGNSVSSKLISKAEIQALENGDVPYFYTYPDSHNLYYLSNEQELKIENVYERTINELILSNINRFSDDDMNRQIRYIKMSFANQKMKNPLKNNLVKMDNIMYKSDTDLYISLAMQIGDYILDNLIYNSSKTEAEIIGLNFDDKGNWIIGYAAATLYDGMGIILFLSYLYRITDITKYKDAAYCLLNGMEKTPIPNNNLSAFLGKGSHLYTHYLMYTIFNDEQFRHKAIGDIESMDDPNLLHKQRLDVIDGLAGTIIVLINIYKDMKHPKLLAIARKMGKVLLDKVENEEMPIMTGMAHGYAGLIYALILIAKFDASPKYLKVANRLLQYENEKKNEDNSNWLDLRQKNENKCQNFWCHGAPGIILSRLKCFENINDAEILNILKSDIQNSIGNLTKYAQIDGRDCLCHGFWGNIDILVSLGKYNTELANLAKQYANKHIQSVIKNGYIFPNDNNVEVYNFMLGLSGVGYSLLRLINNNVPSVLALEV